MLKALSLKVILSLDLIVLNYVGIKVHRLQSTLSLFLTVNVVADIAADIEFNDKRESVHGVHAISKTSCRYQQRTMHTYSCTRTAPEQNRHTECAAQRATTTRRQSMTTRQRRVYQQAHCTRFAKQPHVRRTRVLLGRSLLPTQPKREQAAAHIGVVALARPT